MSTAERERNAKLRRQKFEEHLNATKETIKAKFATLIESYNKKNPNSPIRRSTQEIADFVINDLRSGARGLDNYLKHEPNAVGVPIARIESYEYVAGSMRIPGFRGELYTADLANHPGSIACWRPAQIILKP